MTEIRRKAATQRKWEHRYWQKDFCVFHLFLRDKKSRALGDIYLSTQKGRKRRKYAEKAATQQKWEQENCRTISAYFIYFLANQASRARALRDKKKGDERQ